MSLNRYGAETKIYLEKDKEYLSNIWSISGHAGCYLSTKSYVVPSQNTIMC